MEGEGWVMKGVGGMEYQYAGELGKSRLCPNSDNSPSVPTIELEAHNNSGITSIKI